MTENLLRNVQRAGCRLCLAPDSECVPIFATAAADKEPLSSKIQACVNIKVHQGDRLSARVCHACISYLNSWQSFKNRCYAAQKKQRGMLEMWLAKERARIKTATQQQNQQQSAQRQMEQYRQQLDQQRILKDALSQPSGSSYKNSQNNNSVDISFIKSEPLDDAQNETEGIEDEDEMDPSQFLARDNEEEEAAGEEGGGPPILTSLGLTHINHVNPYSFLSTELGNEYQSETDTSLNMYTAPQPVRRAPGSQPCCTICNMKFSNRANARRHERNIHGIKAEPLTSTPHSSGQLHSIMRPIMRPLMRPLKKKKVIPPIVYDYTKPELYREFLTESKLYFIKRHIDFLEQYQNMKCTCCDREFQTYKTFMVHMRKRYDTLSRNLCFKCLKQFQSKALFVAHLKKKNCLNLYKVYCADDTISKDPLPPIQTRVGTKEIIANKVYGCKLCSKTFRLKMDFRGHVYEAHGDVQKKETMGPECGFCKNVFEDPSIRRRHYNNMECIVFLICGTCDEKFDNLANYIEHVYAEHLKPSNDSSVSQMMTDSLASTSDTSISNDQELPTPSTQSVSHGHLSYPQNCKVCGKQYNNYYNVLRHMESKHPDQLPDTYRCEPCDIGYPRQTELREHLNTVHGVTMPKIKREVFTCRICMTTYDNKDVWIDHQATNHSTFYCSSCEMETESRKELEEHLESHAKQMYTCTVCYHSFHSERGLETHLAVMHQMKKDDMPEANGGQNDEGMDIDGEYNLNDDDDDDGALEISADVHVNGETEGDFENGNIGDEDEDDDGNEGDNDETIEHQVSKKMKLEIDHVNEELNMIPCPLCPESFNGKIALSNHMRSHGAALPPHFYGNNAKTNNKRAGSVNSRMRCRICQKRIHTKLGFKRHMLVVHQVRDCVFIKCKICPAEFSNDKGLKVHMFRTHNVTVQQMQNDERLRPTPKQESTTGSNLPKILPKIAPKLMFECDICHTVYRNHEQLSSHRSIVHGADNIIDSTTENLDHDDIQEPQLPVPEAWWQCRYCNDTFNASKKLTIHMNSHEEHDNTDNTCKDCGNVYRTRKSLWVHRHKKHPRIPNPSNCELCEKVFFDKTELYYHLKTHSNDDVYSQLTELQQQLENDPSVKLEKTQQSQASNYGGGEEDLNCHICGHTFHDKRVLSKHLRLHELDNNPLHTLLDVDDENGLSDYSYPSYQGQMVDGEYACDMCPKTFPLINALKVHRGWHFRSPDGRQVTDPSNMWQPDSVPQSKFKRTKAANPPTCQYCHSTFASGNNLRRHIVEVHKRNEAKMMRENGTVSDTVFVEKELECQSCAITFSNRPEWVDHKISHARTMKPSTTFEWGCEICGKVFTRKERLLAHMVTHLSNKDEGSSIHSADQSEMGENSRSSMSSQSHSQQSQESSSLQQRMQQQQLLKQKHQLTISNVKTEEYNTEEEEEDDDIEIDEDEAEDEQATPEAAAYSCDLCQVYFRTAKELRRHVTSHIINNGPETSQSTDSERNQQHGMMVDGFKCRLCGSSSASHMGMIQCMENHKNPTNLRCGKCQLYFTNEQQVLDHESLCHPQSFA